MARKMKETHIRKRSVDLAFFNSCIAVGCFIFATTKTCNHPTAWFALSGFFVILAFLWFFSGRQRTGKRDGGRLSGICLGLFELIVVLACLAYICSMIFWINPPLSGILVVGAILLFLAYTLAREGIRNIVGERPDNPGGSGDGGRKWWPIRFFIFIGPILYGVSATIIQMVIQNPRVRRVWWLISGLGEEPEDAKTAKSLGN
jgi:hypothetical protein